jgi:thioredoxin 1
LPVLPPLHTAGTTSVTSEEQFRALAASPTVVIFEFGAAWCKKCKTLALHISKLAEENPSLPVFTVDIDELVDLSSELGVSAIPRIVVYRDGRIVDDYTGSAEAEVTALFDRLKN